MLTEDRVINYAKSLFNKTNNKRLIGDDAAVIDFHSGKKIISTIDTLCEGVHFTAKDKPYEIGKKLVSVSFSDMAAMGAMPRYLFLSFALTSNIKEKWIKDLFKGIKEISDKFNVICAGGDTVGNKNIVLTSSVLGELFGDNPIYRKGAKPGSLIYTTGFFGFSYTTKHHLNFTPRVEEIKWLSSHMEILSLTDASDGLAKSIELLTQNNGLGADISLENIRIRTNKDSTVIPACPEAFLKHTKKGKDSGQAGMTCKAGNRRAVISHALFDGEDFELVFTSNKISKNIIENFEEKFNLPLSEIGCVNSSGKITCFLNDKKLDFEKKYFNHFN